MRNRFESDCSSDSCVCGGKDLRSNFLCILVNLLILFIIVVKRKDKNARFNRIVSEGVVDEWDR